MTAKKDTMSIEDFVTDKMCKDRHKWSWTFPGVVIAVLAVVVISVYYTFDLALAACAATQDFRAELLNQNKEIEVKMATKTQKVQDNWDASQRQFLGLRNDIIDMKTTIKEGDDRIAVQLSGQNDLLMKVLDVTKKQ